MKITLSVLSGIIGILAALLVAGCATVQPEPGPWVLKDGAWCQANVPDCQQRAVKYQRPWYEHTGDGYIFVPNIKGH